MWCGGMGGMGMGGVGERGVFLSVAGGGADGGTQVVIVEIKERYRVYIRREERESGQE